MTSAHTIDVRVTEYAGGVTPTELLLVRDRIAMAQLRKDHVPAWYSPPKTKTSTWAVDLASPRFQWWVDKYAEVVTIDPWQDVVAYYQRRAQARGSPAPGPLHYPGREPILNVTAMASACEALAGLYCEEAQGWQSIGRPGHVTPDLIFRDPDTGRRVLVEVKSSARRSNPKNPTTAAMIDLLKVLAITKSGRPAPYMASVIMVSVNAPEDVELTVLTLEESSQGAT